MPVGEAASHAVTVEEAGGHERQERHLSQRGLGSMGWSGDHERRGTVHCGVGRGRRLECLNPFAMLQ